MKKCLSLVVFSSLLIAGTAFAYDHEHGQNRLRLAELNFSCQFEDEDMTTPSSGTYGEKKECKALAQVFAWIGDRDEMTAMERDGNLINKLSVECGNGLIYADGANFAVNKRLLAISALSGRPALIIKRPEDEGTMKDKDLRAFLLVRGERLRGECKVRIEPIGPRHE
jgi:hypothetical protein